jgi:phosphatidylinositol-3-phosphatase
VAASPETSSRGGLDALAKTPRSAAAAILAMLGFGAFVGSLVGGANASDPGAIVVAFSPPPAQTTPSTTSPPVTSATPAARTVTVESPAASRSAAPTSSPAAEKTTPGDGTAPARPALPPINHVFLIVLSNQTFATSASAAFLTKTLAAKGELIGSYYSVAGGSLANEIALISGQGPTPATQANCPQFQPIQPGTVDEDGQVQGDGCGYPAGVITIGDELEAAKLTWKAYLGTRTATDDPSVQRCRPLPGSTTGNAAPYAAWRNPFLYFNTTKGACLKESVPLAQLDKDLASGKDTPALSYIVPDLCDNGAPTPCEPSATPGMQAADAFLQAVVPKIEKSPAYKSGGMIAITFDQAPQSGPQPDSSSCCGQPTYPNLTGSQVPSTGSPAPPAPPAPPVTTPPADTTPTDTVPPVTPAPPDTTPTDTAPPVTTAPPDTTPTHTAPPVTTGPPDTTTTETTPQSTPPSVTPQATAAIRATTTTPDAGGGDPAAQTPAQAPGGGKVGLLLLSKYVKPDTINGFDSFNHFSLLASIEDLFGLDRLGYAAASGLPVFGASVYTAYSSS